MKAETKQNFLSVDKKTARNSHGEFYNIGEKVGHEGAPKESPVTILEFREQTEANEIKVFTSGGHCHLDFLFKVEKENIDFYIAAKSLSSIYTAMLMLQDGSWSPNKRTIVNVITNIKSIADAIGAELKDIRDGGN